MTAEPATVEPPKHPLPALTTFELRDYRRQLESAITFFDKQDPVPRPETGCKPGLTTCWPSRNRGPGWPMPADRPHDVSSLTTGQLERARRDLQISLALAFPGSPVRVSILAEMTAIDAELAQRPATKG
jgi:hypothetical protein